MTPEHEEIAISGHEAGHAVASVRRDCPFEYVTLDDDNLGPHVMPIENEPRPIPFYYGDCHDCEGDRCCSACRAEERRAESWIIVAMCGNLGAELAGHNVAGAEIADLAFLIRACRAAFGDTTPEQIRARTAPMRQSAIELMRSETTATLAVARALRERRRLTMAEVVKVMAETPASEPLRT